MTVPVLSHIERRREAEVPEPVRLSLTAAGLYLMGLGVASRRPTEDPWLAKVEHRRDASDRSRSLGWSASIGRSGAMRGRLGWNRRLLIGLDHLSDAAVAAGEAGDAVLHEELLALQVQVNLVAALADGLRTEEEAFRAGIMLKTRVPEMIPLWDETGVVPVALLTRAEWAANMGIGDGTADEPLPASHYLDLAFAAADLGDDAAAEARAVTSFGGLFHHTLVASRHYELAVRHLFEAISVESRAPGGVTDDTLRDFSAIEEHRVGAQEILTQAGATLVNRPSLFLRNGRGRPVTEAVAAAVNSYRAEASVLPSAAIDCWRAVAEGFGDQPLPTDERAALDAEIEIEGLVRLSLPDHFDDPDVVRLALAVGEDLLDAGHQVDLSPDWGLGLFTGALRADPADGPLVGEVEIDRLTTDRHITHILNVRWPLDIDTTDEPATGG